MTGILISRSLKKGGLLRLLLRSLSSIIAVIQWAGISSSLGVSSYEVRRFDRFQHTIFLLVTANVIPKAWWWIGFGIFGYSLSYMHCCVCPQCLTWEHPTYVCTFQTFQRQGFSTSGNCPLEGTVNSPTSNEVLRFFVCSSEGQIHHHQLGNSSFCIVSYKPFYCVNW